MSSFLAMLRPGQIQPQTTWIKTIGERKQQNIERMAARLNANPSPMNFSSALRAIRDVLADKPDIYVVNEGANTLDFGRDIIDMHEPRKRLDSGTWGVMGIGMGYAIGAAVTSGKPVVAIEGDSAFGFSGMEIETICRYSLPIVIVVFNNGGIYRGDDVNRSGGADPSPTILMRSARYDKLIEAFGGTGYHVTDPQGLTKALAEAVASGKPAIINCVIDPTAGTESGHLQSLNPTSQIGGGGK
jgi:oxalyl-CoA decarboxylase